MKFVYMFLLFMSISFADPIKIIKIYDGDTITALTSQKEKIKIRLYGIDAPELKQPFGKASKRHLIDLISNKSLNINEKGKDKYGRTLAVLYNGDQDINAQMVIDGYAWAYDKFSKDYVAFQQNAQALKKGLWIDKDVVRPSDFRKFKKSSR
jgi:ATP-dependent hsl protease ATP-binding subunit hslU|nr:MAG TPA: nuclease-like protein [Caudoviricetes sp.]